MPHVIVRIPHLGHLLKITLNDIKYFSNYQTYLPILNEAMITAGHGSVASVNYNKLEESVTIQINNLTISRPLSA